MSKMVKVGIIDYDMSNLFSVMQACRYVGIDVEIVSDPDRFASYDGLIFPGVGAFGAAISTLRSTGADLALKSFTDSGKPLMGVCLGMQLLFSESEEFGPHKGLGLVEGSVIRFKSPEPIRVPQIAWNRIFGKSKWNDSPLQVLNDGEFMYFVHSFYVVPRNSDVVLATTNYMNIEYCSAIKQNNIFAVQFHPEKSGASGLKIYESFKNFF
jgi:glutamine amidotransferase